MSEALKLENQKQLLRRYYQGQQMESPAGGFLMTLGVRSLPEGGARAIFECSASSLRYQLEIPKATRAERTFVKQTIAEGTDPTCPRHGPGQRLSRAGSDWVCALCGVSYG